MRNEKASSPQRSIELRRREKSLLFPTLSSKGGEGEDMTDFAVRRDEVQDGAKCKTKCGVQRGKAAIFGQITLTLLYLTRRRFPLRTENELSPTETRKC